VRRCLTRPQSLSPFAGRVPRTDRRAPRGRRLRASSRGVTRPRRPCPSAPPNLDAGEWAGHIRDGSIWRWPGQCFTGSPIVSRSRINEEPRYLQTRLFRLPSRLVGGTKSAARVPTVLMLNQRPSTKRQCREQLLNGCWRVSPCALPDHLPAAFKIELYRHPRRRFATHR
jgi:hypothetical protein